MVFFLKLSSLNLTRFAFLEGMSASQITLGHWKLTIFFQKFSPEAGYYLSISHCKLGAINFKWVKIAQCHNIGGVNID